MKSECMNGYYGLLDKEVDNAYSVANSARSKGFDPNDEVEISRANSVGEKVVGLISIVAPEIKNSNLVKRISELEVVYGVQDWRVAYKIAEEVAKEKICSFDNRAKAIEVGLRVGLAYLTNGVVSSPLEGFVRLELKRRRDGKEYFCLYFGGPIRSAGTTTTCVFVALADYIRKVLGYSIYDPMKDEVKRSSTEVNYFHERITNLQYLPGNEEIEFLTEHLPVQIDGDPSETIEVPNYKDLARVGTNRLRNGYCLVMAECLAQKGKKFWGVFSKWYKDFELDHWNFLEQFIELQKKVSAKGDVKKELGKVVPDYNYIKDLVAGRPILGYPLRDGGFRLRYGRSRISGLSSMSIHPATMCLLNNYIATGTQLRYERPGKSSAMGLCDSIEGPIVKLRNGDVLILDSEKVAKKVSKDVEEILYLGDMLINFGEFLNRAHVLVPPGYCEEWWLQELKANGVKNDFGKEISFDMAYELSKKYDVPLYPRYSYYWNCLESKQILSLIDWMTHSVIEEEKIIFPLIYDVEKDLVGVDPKRALELLGVPHFVINQEYVVVENDWAKALRCCFSGYKKKFDVDFLLNSFDNSKNGLDIINGLAEVKLRDKSGIYIGARMGRPEKSKMRKMVGSPHALFPVGKEGGRLRSFQSAIEKGKVAGQFSVYKCDCGKEGIYRICDCGRRANEIWNCKVCGRRNEKCRHNPVFYEQRVIDINEYVKKARLISGIDVLPGLIKGVRGTSNENHIPENLVKGLLRARHDLYVNKDGTIRYDMTEMPMTAFYPREIGTNVERLRLLGYEKDIYGDELVSGDQLVELKPSDIVLPNCDESLNEGADKVLFRIANFIDDLLKNFYKAEGFYNLKNKDDLVGHLVVGLAPHISAGIIGRIIGFSKTQCCFAHPLWHSAVRRDCFSYDTILPIYNGDSWQNVKIGEFVESLNPQKVVDGYGTLEAKSNGFSTLSLNTKTRKVEVMPIKWFTKHMPSKIIKIKVEDGREIKMTRDHKFYVYCTDRIIEKKASNLGKDDRLIIVKKEKNILRDLVKGVPISGIKIDLDKEFTSVKIKSFEFLNKEVTYCLHVPGHHNVLANGIIAKQCEGDELCVILLMDALLNFSKSFLPAHRGATQDAPLVLTSILAASEVDEMVFDMDVVWEYPLEFYNACLDYKDPREVAVEVLGNRLGKGGEYEGIGFTHSVSDINMGVRCSAYKLLPTMEEKLRGQMDLAERIRAVDEDDVARLVIDRHFIRDIRGNLRKFSMQEFRCSNCNEKFRRPPLSGVCSECGGRIIFTVSEGTVIKYLGLCLELAEKYDIPSYLKQTIELTKQRVELVFGKEKEKQEGLGKWV